MLEHLLKTLRQLPARAVPKVILVRPDVWEIISTDPRAGPFVKGDTFQGIQIQRDPFLANGLEFRIVWD